MNETPRPAHPVTLSSNGLRQHRFLILSTGESWSVENPAQWCVDHINSPLFERADERLPTLDAKRDSERIIRLVVRRCGLLLIERVAARYRVHYWSHRPTVITTMRTFFKQQRIPIPRIELALLHRRTEQLEVLTEDDFKPGWSLDDDFPLDLYMRKWQRRRVQEPDDWEPAPESFSNYSWEGIEQPRAPWAALKHLWRYDEEQKLCCVHCDSPLVVYGWRHALVNGGIYRLCLSCRQTQSEYCNMGKVMSMVRRLSGTAGPKSMSLGFSF